MILGERDDLAACRLRARGAERVGRSPWPLDPHDPLTESFCSIGREPAAVAVGDDDLVGLDTGLCEEIAEHGLYRRPMPECGEHDRQRGHLRHRDLTVVATSP